MVCLPIQTQTSEDGEPGVTRLTFVSLWICILWIKGLFHGYEWRLRFVGRGLAKKSMSESSERFFFPRKPQRESNS